MTIASITIDDFHPVAGPIAEKAKRLDFSPTEWRGMIYKGIHTDYTPEMFYKLLSEAMGREVLPEIEYFRLGIKEDAPTTYIHPDSSCARFAAVWYLVDAPTGVQAGTAFWRHRTTGISVLTNDHRSDARLMKMLEDEGMDESKWDMVSLVGQQFNRLTVYPTSAFHSRYPKDAWGSGPEDGRIVFTSFFN